MKILVTGGAGFIGSHVVTALLGSGHRVTVLDNLSSGRRRNLAAGISFYQGDIRDRCFVLEVMAKEQPEVIYHLAAQVSVPGSMRDPVADAEVNIIGTINVLEAAVQCQVRKIIYSSTAAVYGPPEILPISEQHPVSVRSGYAISKYCAERYLAIYYSLYGLDYTILRYANVYGPRQDSRADGGVIAVFIDSLCQGKPLCIHGDGEQTRDFIFVTDVVVANLRALVGGSGTIMNIGSGSSISIIQLLDVIHKMRGSEIHVQHCQERPGDIKHSRLDNSLACKTLSWNPGYTLEEGLQQTMMLWDEFSDPSENLLEGAEFVRGVQIC